MSIVQKIEVRDVADGDHTLPLESRFLSEPLPMIQKSIAAIRRDLPELLKRHRGSWVAYNGDERIGFGKSQTGLYEECLRRGLTRDDFVVCGVDEGVFDPDEELEITSDI